MATRLERFLRRPPPAVLQNQGRGRRIQTFVRRQGRHRKPYPGGGGTVTSLLVQVLRASELANRSETTQACRALIAEAGGRNPSKVTALDLHAACAGWQHLRPKTRRQYHNALKRVCRLLDLPDRLIKTIPVVKARPCRDRLVQEAERERLLAAASPALRLYLLLCSDLALRAGTAVRVAPVHVDLVSRTLSVPTKNAVLVTLPLSSRLLPLVQAACSFAPPGCTTPLVVLLGVSPSPWLKAKLAAAFHRLRNQLRMDRFTSHDLRRSTARAVYLESGDLREAQAVLGHTSLRATFDYLETPNVTASLASIEAAIARKETIR